MALTRNRIQEGFSISHAAILDPATGLEQEFGDIYGVRSGTIAWDQSNYINTGDDVELSIWNWANKANLTIQSGFWSFETLELITGSKAKYSGTGDAEVQEFPLLETRQMHNRYLPLLVRIPGRTEEGVGRVVDFLFYKVQFQPIGFGGMSYKSGLTVDYNAQALFSDFDEKGAPCVDSVTGDPTKQIGRIVSRPAF